MEEMIKIDGVEAYHRLFGLETLHPLVSVVDMSRARFWPERFRLRYELYGLFMKDVRCGEIKYGRRAYDYQEGTIVSYAPGQVTEVELAAGKRPTALGLLFHPDLIRGTSLGREIGRYSFFSYEANEALHLSEAERQVARDCLAKIRMELERGADRHTRRLLVANIELLLDYCLRFYERQFATRERDDRDVLVRFERLLDEYYQGDRPAREGLPTVRYFADKVCLSPNYFGDLIKRETGVSAQASIQNKILSVAKEWILGSDKPVSQIAYDLGFQYPQHFSRLFKSVVGRTPNQFRTARAR